ncbi:MAG: EscN/YscN/HrcN family type III secretion system ATPase, partial [Persicimonas sp.]
MERSDTEAGAQKKSSLLDTYLDRLDRVDRVQVRGRVREVTGLVVRASVPEARVGEVVEVTCDGGDVLRAEVVGFEGEDIVLMPLGGVEGLGPQSEVEPLGRPMSIRCGEGLLGRVLDGLGRPMDGRGSLRGPGFEEWSIMRGAPDPLERKRITEPLEMGIRAIDGLLTVGKGQRVGLFAGSGVGKSTLMGQIAKGCAADVIVVCLVGERGREVRDFLEEVLGPEGLERSVVVCATSDQPSLVRLKSAFVATAVAEWFRDQGASVMFMMDSV